MTSTIQTAFTAKFPGPYVYLRSSDGVDETFELTCVASKQHIASTYFWDAEDPCRVVTATITAALNLFAGWQAYEPLMFESATALFMQEFSGPFHIRRERCPGRGPRFEVFCCETDDAVLHCFESATPGEAQQIAKHIARALNALLLGIQK